MPLVNLDHDFSIVEPPDPFGAGALIPIDKCRAENGSGYARLFKGIVHTQIQLVEPVVELGIYTEGDSS